MNDAEVVVMTLARLVVVTCIGGVIASAWSGCKRDQDKSGAGTTTLTGADLYAMSSDAAVERVVVARCTRERACNNIGDGRHYGSPDACTRELRPKVGADLDPSKCPHGVDTRALDDCMDAIRNESCNDPGSTLSRLDACKTSTLCTAR